MRFAYSEYLGNMLGMRDIPGAATRGVAFRNLRMKPSPLGSFSSRDHLRIARISHASRMRPGYAPIAGI
jgi:hypothetical protein